MLQGNFNEVLRVGEHSHSWLYAQESFLAVQEAINVRYQKTKPVAESKA